MPRTTGYLLIGLVAVSLFALRLLLPSDLGDKAQEQFAAYVLDAVHNGHWISQYHIDGSVTSKPPLYTWLAAIATLPFEKANLFALYLPCAIATLGIAWLLYGTGTASFNSSAGLLAGLTYLLSHVAAKQIALARPDGVFALCITIAAVTAYRAWVLGRGWTWFWMASAAATLTKGPLGLLLASGGLLAVLWEKRSGHPTGLRGTHWPGVGLFLLMTVGWFALAYHAVGQPLIDKMIFRELFGHAIRDYRGSLPLEHFYLTPIHFALRFAPWSLFALLGFWRVWRSPSDNPNERRFERFVFCWFFSGLIVFSLAAHQRGDLLFPLIPAAALMAGRELARLTGSLKRPIFLAASAFVVLVVFAGNALYYGGWIQRGVRFEQTQGMQQLAAAVRQQTGENFPLVYVDTRFALQFFLNTFSPLVSPERAGQLLSGEAAVFVAVIDYDAVRSRLLNKSLQLYEVARWPLSDSPHIRIISNHPRLEWTEEMVSISHSILFRLHHVRLLKRHGMDFTVQRISGSGWIELVNESNQPHLVRVTIAGEGKADTKERLLEAGALWRVEL